MIVSASLSDLARVIYKKLNKVRHKGWFSRFVSEQLVEHFSKNFEKKILTENLVEITKNRNKLEKQISQVVKKLKKWK